LDKLDADLTSACNRSGREWLDWPAVFIAYSAHGWLMTVVTIGVLIWNPMRWSIALVLSMAAAGLSQHLLKRLIRRPRPYEVLPVRAPLGKLWRARGTSFPSGDVAAAATLAVVAGAGFSADWVWLLILWVLGIAFGRVYCGLHYPSDTLAGMVLGATIGLIGLWCMS
jgi:undecaprenyl-diphosphatase